VGTSTPYVSRARLSFLKVLRVVASKLAKQLAMRIYWKSKYRISV